MIVEVLIVVLLCYIVLYCVILCYIVLYCVILCYCVTVLLCCTESESVSRTGPGLPSSDRLAASVSSPPPPPPPPAGHTSPPSPPSCEAVRTVRTVRLTVPACLVEEEERMVEVEVEVVV